MVDILGGIWGAAVGTALSFNPFDKKIVAQTAYQGLTGGTEKVNKMIWSGVGGVTGFAVGGTKGITEGVQKGGFYPITKQITEYKETIEKTGETLLDIGQYLPYIAVGVAALVVLIIATRK